MIHHVNKSKVVTLRSFLVATSVSRQSVNSIKSIVLFFPSKIQNCYISEIYSIIFIINILASIYIYPQYSMTYHNVVYVLKTFINSIKTTFLKRKSNINKCFHYPFQKKKMQYQRFHTVKIYIVSELDCLNVNRTAQCSVVIYCIQIEKFFHWENFTLL